MRSVKYFSEEIKNGIDDYLSRVRMPKADQAVFYDTFMHLGDGSAGLPAPDTVEDVIDQVVLSMNAASNSNYPLVDDLRQDDGPGFTFPTKVVKLLSMLAVAQMLPSAAAATAPTALQLPPFQGLSTTLYPNLGAEWDINGCRKGSGPCGYRSDPATYPGVKLLTKNTRLKPNARYMYSLGADGKMHIIDANNNPNGYKHAHLTYNGGQARAAGHFMTDANSRIIAGSNTSGHYKPGPTHAINPADCSISPRPLDNSLDVFATHLAHIGIPLLSDVALRPVGLGDRNFQTALKDCQDELIYQARLKKGGKP